MKTKFSIKSMMVATLVCALVTWALAPTVHDLWTLRHYRAKNASLHETFIEKGLNPTEDTSSMTVKREYDSRGWVVRTTYYLR